MELSPEIIGAAVLALTGLFTALTTLLSNRSRDQRKELDQLRDDHKSIRKQLRLADQWISAIMRLLDQRGIKVPPPPDGLDTITPEVPSGDD